MWTYLWSRQGCQLDIQAVEVSDSCFQDRECVRSVVSQESPCTRYFDTEVKKYCFMWREGGQFSTEKYNIKKNS